MSRNDKNYEGSRRSAVEDFASRPHPYFHGSDALVFIPVSNEEYTIGKVISDVRANCTFDILVINDGSTDSTSSILSDSKVEVLNHGIRTGSKIFLSGLQIAYSMGYKYAIKIDGDDQHDSRDILRLYACATETGADEVVGSRHMHDFNDSILRLQGLGMWFVARLVSSLSRRRVTDATSGFKIWNRKACKVVIDAFERGKLGEDSTFLIEEQLIAAKSGLKVGEIPVVMRPREFGETKSFSTKKLLLFPLSLVHSVMRGYFR